MSPLNVPAAVATAPAAATVEPGPATPSSPATSSSSAAATLPRHGETESRPGALPRRVPRRETAPAEKAEETEDREEAEETASGTAPALQDRTERTLLPHDDTGAARPLRRRVRGATLRTTAAEAAQQAAHGPARPADAHEVRSALEEFEAAVERAHRDSGTGTPAPAPQPTPDQNYQNHQSDQSDQRHQNHQSHQNHLPEGAEQ
ncbi:hypothetical protein SAVCW2_60030 [Streptomyces avermitilis]|nr:hypothetical protein SAVCW2_60030 [Streptomyces avermitilis]